MIGSLKGGIKRAWYWRQIAWSEAKANAQQAARKRIEGLNRG